MSRLGAGAPGVHVAVQGAGRGGSLLSRLGAGAPGVHVAVPLEGAH